SLSPVDETTGTPEQIRAFVRQVVAEGADLVKIFATKSIREGGGPTLTQAQVDAACGEARSLGKRAIVHAQGPEGARAAVLAGCTSVRSEEHTSELQSPDHLVTLSLHDALPISSARLWQREQTWSKFSRPKASAKAADLH